MKAGFALLGEAPTLDVADEPGRWLVPDGEDRSGTASRLCDLGGITDEEYVETFVIRDNLLHYARNGGWDESDRLEAKANVESLWRLVTTDRPDILGIVCLGRRPANMFYPKLDPLRWTWFDRVGPSSHRRIGVCYLPHTSGRCRFWNSETNRNEGRDFIREIVAFAITGGRQP